MAISFSSLNGDSFGATDTGAYDATAITNLGGGNYTVDPTFGSVVDNLWSGTFGSPAPNDLTLFTLQFPTQTQGNILQYVATDASGHSAPAIGFEVLGYNAHGILGQQINGYFPGESTALINSNLNANQFFVFSDVDLSVTEPGYAGPTAAQLTFGNTGPLPFSSVPEPSMIALLPMMAIALIVSRMPSVRALFEG